MVRPLALLYAVVLAASAFLVFWIQPLVAGMLLPLLGGAPAVWNTVVLFFQAMLLSGYLYAHGLARLPVRAQLIVHASFFLVAAAALPDGSAAWASPPQAGVAVWLLGTLALYIGLPYLFLASTAPLLQHWYGRSAEHGSTDPYFLYAASNLGSFAALLSYPVLLERYLSLSEQIVTWQRLFIGVGLGLAGAAMFNRAGLSADSTHPRVPAPPTAMRDVLRWLGLAFLPSSLMLGITTHITTDIAAVSFFWVAPLALYLATFVAAFSAVGQRVAKACRFILPFAITAALLVSFRSGFSSVLLIPLELLVFTCIAMELHFRLYQARPPLSRLTNFYLWVALGGLLGGVFNGLVAPVIFDSIFEYPLVLAVAVAVVEWPLFRKLQDFLKSGPWHGFSTRDAIAIGAVVAVIAAWVTDARFPDGLIVAGLLLVSALAGAYAIGAATGGRLLATFCYLAVLLLFDLFDANREIHAGRSFFGAFSVYETDRDGIEVRVFSHGTTVHGLQATDTELPVTPHSYYAGIAPVLNRFLEARRPADIGVTGLGTGSLACLGNDGDRVSFFEIDPAVEAIAREYFTYLDRCPAQNDVLLGDARLRLATVESGRFDLLVLDAFSSDAVPLHLLTNEAAQEYERVLKADGLLAFHISNRYLDLKPVLGRLAGHRGWKAWWLTIEPGPDEPLADSSEFVLATPMQSAGEWLDGTPNVEPLPDYLAFPLWTDDHSNLLRILRW